MQIQTNKPKNNFDMIKQKIKSSSDEQIHEYFFQSLREHEEKYEKLMREVLELRQRLLEEKIHKQEQRLNLISRNGLLKSQLEEIFDLDPTQKKNLKDIDGLLSDYVDPFENSTELVESVRSG